MKKLFALILTIFLSSPMMLGASAAGFLSGDNVFLDQEVFEDYYVAGGNADIDQNIDGDLYISGGAVTIRGDVSQDVIVAGGVVRIEGNIGDDLRVAGGDVTLAGNVGDDAISFAGKLDISPNTVIGGDLILGAGYTAFDGVVGGNVFGGTSRIDFRGRVSGNVNVTVEDKIVFYENSHIDGNLNYSALIEIDVPEEVVGGEITFNKFETEQKLKDLTYFYLVAKLFDYLALLIVAFVLVLLMPKGLARAGKDMREHIWQSLGIGAFTIIIGIVGSLALLLTIVGIPLALLFYAFLFVALYLSRIFVAAWLASYLSDFVKKKKHLRLTLFFSMALGLLVYYLIGLIPIVGWIVSGVMFVIGLGGLVRAEKGWIKYLIDKKQL